MVYLLFLVHVTLLLSMLITVIKGAVLDQWLKGKVCVVTGASRGIGKGIALGLAERGATIYVTGRSKTATTPKENPDVIFGSIYDTVQEIQKLGGKGYGCIVDHRDDEQVKQLFKRVEDEQGRLDILVNNCFQIPSRPDGVDDKNLLFRNFWEQPGWFYDAFMNVGLRSHYIASVYAAPIMMKTAATEEGKKHRPLIAHISSFGGVSYSFNVAYGVGKAGVDRLAKDMHIELKDRYVDNHRSYFGHNHKVLIITTIY